MCFSAQAALVVATHLGKEEGGREGGSMGGRRRCREAVAMPLTGRSTDQRERESK